MIEFSMASLFKYLFHLHGVNFFELRTNEHRDQANDVQLFLLNDDPLFLLPQEVRIHYSYRPKICVWIVNLEHSEDLNHPVNHSSSMNFLHLVNH